VIVVIFVEWTGCRTRVKHENRNPTGAFKVRGGVNLLAQLSEAERRRGRMRSHGRGARSSASRRTGPARRLGLDGNVLSGDNLDPRLRAGILA
jgi:hypothetical protein